MKVFEINSVPYGSTGRIMFQIAEKVIEHGGEAITSCSYTKARGIAFPKDFYQIGNAVGKMIHIRLAKITGRHGCYSSYATMKLIEKIKKEDPDVIHIHNLHGWFINIKMLFNFFKDCNKPIVWTFHDCWPFTGHCPFYILVSCDKWKTGCFECPKHKDYPMSYMDDSKFQYSLKKRVFSGVENLTIVTPSHWLANEVKESFLKEYNTVVIHNGINTDIFKPSNSDFKAKYGIKDEIVLLGVAFDWGERKGLKFFEKLEKELDDNYRIVLVGLEDSQREKLSKKIISIPSTQSQRELAEIYSSADVLLNPTLEDNFPTVNIEALACGTPVVTFQTGGSSESIGDDCGWVIPYGDYESLKRVVQGLGEKTKTVIENCVARGNMYKKEDKYMEYVELFESLIGERSNEC